MFQYSKMIFRFPLFPSAVQWHRIVTYGHVSHASSVSILRQVRAAASTENTSAATRCARERQRRRHGGGHGKRCSRHLGGEICWIDIEPTYRYNHLYIDYIYIYIYIYIRASICNFSQIFRYSNLLFHSWFNVTSSIETWTHRGWSSSTGAPWLTKRSRIKSADFLKSRIVFVFKIPSLKLTNRTWNNWGLVQMGFGKASQVDPRK